MRAYGWFGLALLLVAEYGLFQRIEPFYSWFYCFAWWSYILIADNLLFKLRGFSLLTTRRAELLRMLPLSVFVWLLFEGYNLFIRNWGYRGIPESVWERWPGYALAFATVLPGIFITADLLEHVFYRPGDRRAASASEPAGPGRAGRRRLLVLVGLALSLAPFVWPRYFFPAVWLGPIFLLDPMLERLGIRSLSRELAEGNRRRIWSLMAGGLACGLLWEFWNFWAPSRWVYTVPFFENWKVFEMPVLGFLGFPPFALECWILYHLLSEISRVSGRRVVRVAFWIGITLFCVVMLQAIDRNTVLQFAGSIPEGLETWPTFS